MSPSNQYYDPIKMSAQLREMLTHGDTSKLPEFIQEVLMQSVANPLTQAILAPLAQSLAAPLSQYFGSPMGNNRSNETIIVEEPADGVPNSLNPQIFEILGFVVVRTPIPENVNEKDIRVSIASSHITIKGDPSGNEHIIPLPPGTKKEGAAAAFKDRILEIKIPREIEAEAADDINVDFL